MAFKKLTIIFFAITSILSASAYANPNIVTFDFTGSVIYSDLSLNAPIDSLVTGSFSFDVNVPASINYNSSPTTYSYYFYTAPNSLTMNFAGRTITSDMLSYTLYDNFGGNIEDAFILDATSVKLDGLDYGRLNLVLASSYGIENTNALTGSQPPQTLDFSLFNNVQGNSGGLLKNHAYMLQFSILSITPLPEPENYALLLAGLGMIGFIVRRNA